MKSIRILTIATLLIVFSTTAFAITGTSHTTAKLPKTIEFNGIKLDQAFHEEKANQLIVEYIPAGETIDHWTTLFAVRMQTVQLSPIEWATNIARMVTQQNPKLGANVIFSKDTPEKAIVQFITVEKNIIEYNIWKLMKPADYDGIISYQFAERNYGEITDDFKKRVGNMKQTVDAMQNYEF